MPSNGFHHVEVGLTSADPPPCPPDLHVLHWPAGFHPLVSRSILHETLHLWQYASSGYLLGMAAEDWERLKAFERGGRPPPPGPRREAFARAKHPDMGFSAKDLHEALARFWETHILGPPELIDLELADPKRKIAPDFAARYRAANAAGRIRHPEKGYTGLSFDLAMECAAGDYAEPYLWLRRQVTELMAGVLFPLCGYFAFQTPDPVRAFNMLVRHASHEFPDLLLGEVIHSWWRKGLMRVAKLAIGVPSQFGAEQLEDLRTVVAKGGLGDHPVWPLLEELHESAAERFKRLPLFDMMWELDPGRLAVAHGHLNLSYALACPGDPGYRGELVRCLAPSALCFADGTVWNLGALGAEQDGDWERVARHRRVADASRKLRIRWCHFQRASQGYGPKCTA